MVLSIDIKGTQTIETDTIIWKTPRENDISLIWFKLVSLFIKEAPPIPISDNGIGNSNIVISKPKKYESDIIWKDNTKIWEIDWTVLWYELVNWSPPWTYLTKIDFIKSLFVALIALMLTCTDVVFDVVLAFNYIHGVKYLYQFANESDSKISEMNCTYINKDNSDFSYPYKYYCFARDPGFGYLTLALSFTPGILFTYYLVFGLWNKTTKTYAWIVIFLTPLFVITFPFLLIFTKIIALFHYGEEFQRFIGLLGNCEMLMETFLQWILQVYLSEFHFATLRAKNLTQVVSLFKSHIVVLLQLTKFFMENKMMKTHHESHISTIKRIFWILGLNLFLSICILMNLSRIILPYFTNHSWDYVLSFEILVFTWISFLLVYKYYTKKFDFTKLICNWLCLLFLQCGIHLYYTIVYEAESSMLLLVFGKYPSESIRRICENACYVLGIIHK